MPTLIVAALSAAVLVWLWNVANSGAAPRLRVAWRLRLDGKVDEAALILMQIVAEGNRDPSVVNVAVETLISAGRYFEALALPAPEGLDQISTTLVQINLAEAEYNLGRWSAAWQRLERVDPPRWPGICRAGLACQRAWILAHEGDAPAALAAWESANINHLPSEYRAEHHFTHAAALLAAGDLANAELAAKRGADIAERPSSERNALFLRARIAAAREDLALAELLCREGAQHPFRGQGGDGLLLWGDVLARLHRLEEARIAWTLAVERDPQSESAALARQRPAAAS